MKLLLHILFYKLISFWKLESRLSVRNSAKSLAVGLVYLLFAYGAYSFTNSTIQYLLETVKIGSFLLHRFILVVLFIFFFAVNIGNIVVSYSTLYKSKEVLFFSSKPIAFSKIFIIKFLDNFFYSSSTLLIILVSVLFGYGSYFNVHWSFYFYAVLFMILPFMFIAAALGGTLLLVIMRYAVKFGLKKVLIVIALLYSIFVVTVYLLSDPINLVQEIFVYYPNIDRYFGFLESPWIKLLPNYWLADSLYWITQNQFDNSVFHIVKLNLLSIITFGIALFASKKLYERTFYNSINFLNHTIKKSNTSAVTSFEKYSFLDIQNDSIIKREMLIFFREPSQWIHLSVMFFLIFVFIASISGIDIIILNSYNVYLKTLVYLTIFLFNIFLIAALSIRFIFPIISLEGEGLWKIKSAPIDQKQLLFKRFLIYLVGIVICGQFISYFSNYQFPKEIAVASQINSAIVAISVASFCFGMGGLFSNFKERSPIRIASSQGASITLLLVIFYLIVLIAILFGPLLNFFNRIEKGLPADNWPLVFSTVILIMLSSIIFSLSLKLVSRSMVRDV